MGSALPRPVNSTISPMVRDAEGRIDATQQPGDARCVGGGHTRAAHEHVGREIFVPIPSPAERAVEIAVAIESAAHVLARSHHVDLLAVVAVAGALLQVVGGADAYDAQVAGGVGDGRGVVVARNGDGRDAVVGGLGDGVGKRLRVVGTIEAQVDYVDGGDLPSVAAVVAGGVEDTADDGVMWVSVVEVFSAGADELQLDARREPARVGLNR